MTDSSSLLHLTMGALLLLQLSLVVSATLECVMIVAKEAHLLEGAEAGVLQLCTRGCKRDALSCGGWRNWCYVVFLMSGIFHMMPFAVSIA
jgi:hypothetical protein